LKINLGTYNNPQTIKVNAQLVEENMSFLRGLLIEYKDIFGWTYKDLKGIPLELTHHHIKWDTLIPRTH
jgi:hypothetical protein